MNVAGCSQIMCSFGGNKIKGPKQGSQNRLRSPMPEGGEQKFKIFTLYFKISVHV